MAWEAAGWRWRVGVGDGGGGLLARGQAPKNCGWKARQRHSQEGNACVWQETCTLKPAIGKASKVSGA